MLLTCLFAQGLQKNNQALNANNEIENITRLDTCSAAIRKLFLEGNFLDSQIEEITQHYNSLCQLYHQQPDAL